MVVEIIISYLLLLLLNDPHPLHTLKIFLLWKFLYQSSYFKMSSLLTTIVVKHPPPPPPTNLILYLFTLCLLLLIRILSYYHTPPHDALFGTCCIQVLQGILLILTNDKTNMKLGIRVPIWYQVVSKLILLTFRQYLSD